MNRYEDFMHADTMDIRLEKSIELISLRRMMRKYQEYRNRVKALKPYGLVADGEYKGAPVVMYHGQAFIIKD